MVVLPIPCQSKQHLEQMKTHLVQIGPANAVHEHIVDRVKVETLFDFGIRREECMQPCSSQD